MSPKQPYTLTLVSADDVPDAERLAAEQRFRQALDSALGDAALVLPVLAAWQRIVASHGDCPDPAALTDAERDIATCWQAAEAAAMTAAFGPHRYLDDARFDIGP